MATRITIPDMENTENLEIMNDSDTEILFEIEEIDEEEEEIEIKVEQEHYVYDEDNNCMTTVDVEELPPPEKLKNFYCNLCKKGFVRECNFMEHLKNHNLVKIYQCEKCSKTFSHPGTLINHNKFRHTTSKPFVCDVCDKGFKSKSDLKRHTICHTRLKMFECLICNKKFGLKENFKRHKCIV